jgi:anti-sigma regulatory factor (Ser/Thr protein kinase)
MDISETLLLDNEPFEVSRAATWLDTLLTDAGLSPRAIASLQVALEEVLSNILGHGYTEAGSHKIEVRVAVDSTAVTLEFFDDGIPFDPTQHEVSSADSNVGTRPGGLGLLFVRRLMDDLAFERVDDRNHLTLRKFVSL